MIGQNELEKIWGEISYSAQSEFEFKRIDKESFPDINIGLNSKLNRCLLLELPNVHNVDFQTVVKKNLALHFFPDTGYIVLELIDSSFFELFNDLILSIYHQIYKISEVDEYSKLFIQTFYKWSEFFDDDKSEKLSVEMLKGIFGELFVLKGMIAECESYHLNDLLNSWRGPYDEANDFVFENKNIEVKTKDIKQRSVSISSEYQLEKEIDKELELWVLSVTIDIENGKSIRQLLEDVKELIVNKMGDFSIILTALQQKNILSTTIYRYDNYRFQAKSLSIYDCAKQNFPKLIKDNTPKAIANIRYSLQLSYLDEYLLKKEDFND